MKVVTAAAMREIEQMAVSEGTPLSTLMERAARGLADAVDATPSGASVLVLVGPGNNGTDGLLAARMLSDRDRRVSVYAFRRPDCTPFTGVSMAAEEDTGGAALRSVLSHADVVVDALLGIGQTRPPEGLLEAILNEVNSLSLAVDRIAADVPTGVNSDTGDVIGTAFRARRTVAMGYPKLGSLLQPGAEYSGSLTVVDLRLPARAAESITISTATDKDIRRLLPSRREDSNKGSFGRVLVVGGSKNYVGAPMLSALASLRIGAGLTEIATPASLVSTLSSHSLDPIYSSLPEREGHVSQASLPALETALTKANAVVVGPGLGQFPPVKPLVTEFLESIGRSGVPCVVDADALNALASTDAWWESGASMVLTPHPGEMARLTKRTIGQVQHDRIGVARNFAQLWGQVVVLKGAGTVVAAPNGEVAVNRTGGANLSVGGTGDVLSGVIGGLLAQGLSKFHAAVVGVYLHGAAGDALRHRYGQSGTLASDLLEEIPRVRYAAINGA